jgi:hypothetical protein
MNDKVAKLNGILLQQELNRDLLKIDESSPVKLLEESSDEKNNKMSPESPRLRSKILEEAKKQNRPSPLKKSNKFSPSKP